MNSNDSKQEQERVLYKDEAQQWNQKLGDGIERGGRINKEFELI